MTELPILATAPFLNAVVTGTSVTAPYTDTYVYNAQGGPLELLRQQSGSTSRYWYVLDGRGNVVALTNASGSVVDRYSYDLWGKPLTKEELIAALRKGYRVVRRRAEEGCECFPANTRIAMARGTTANGQVTATLDAAGRTTAISVTAAGTTTYGYYRHDQPVTATLPGGLSGTMGYDQDTRLTSWSLVGPSTGVPTTTVNLQDGYGYDAANRTAGITVTDNNGLHGGALVLCIVCS